MCAHCSRTQLQQSMLPCKPGATCIICASTDAGMHVCLKPCTQSHPHPPTPPHPSFHKTHPSLHTQEDPFNAIMAGALTGGFLQLRAGLKPAFRAAVMGGVLLVSDGDSQV